MATITIALITASEFVAGRSRADLDDDRMLQLERTALPCASVRSHTHVEMNSRRVCAHGPRSMPGG